MSEAKQGSRHVCKPSCHNPCLLDDEEPIRLGTDIRWQFYESTQFPGLFESVAIDPSGYTYYPVTTPCGRICLRKAPKQ